MNPRRSQNLAAAHAGSVLIIVLWVAFGLVSLAIYFANSMSLELRSADNRVAALEADQAIEAAARYVSNVLARAISQQQAGTLPDPQTYRCEAVPVGDATFWLIGRETNAWQNGPDRLTFGLVDEASRLNLNTASVDMLQALPNMTADLAANIVAWRQSTNDSSAGGAQSETYVRQQPPYLCKNAPFETVAELRLVYGMNLAILYGEDSNLNGMLDPNENDGDVLPPFDNRDSRLDPGLFEYLTVYSRQPTTLTNINNRQQLGSLLAGALETERANQILQRAFGGGGGAAGGPGGSGGGGGAAGGFNSVLQFYFRSGMTADELAKIEGSITASTNIQGLVNVNTAAEAVLACIPGVGFEKAPALVAYRQTNPNYLSSISWVTQVLDQNSALLAGPYITTRSYQFAADVAALGHYGRGYRRVRFVFDTTEGTPRIVFRQDLTHLGWALGRQGRNTPLLARQSR